MFSFLLYFHSLKSFYLPSLTFALTLEYQIIGMIMVGVGSFEALK